MFRFTLAIVFIWFAVTADAAQLDYGTTGHFSDQHPIISEPDKSSNDREVDCWECQPSENDEPWFLMRALDSTRLGCLLKQNNIQVYGWTEGAFTTSSASPTHLPLGFNYRANDFLLHQNWLRLERTVDPDGQQPTFGFRSDTIVPGADYRFTVARGLADNQSGSHGFDPVQFYAQAYLPNVGRGLDIKVGRFFGQYGVESIAGVDTPFVSRAYNFIYNPFTHTGLLTTLKLTEEWSVQNGIVTGSDVFFDSAAEATYIGSLKWESLDKRNSVLLATILGSGEFNVIEDFNNPRVFDLVFTHQINDSLTYTLDALYGYQSNVPGMGTANWYAFVNYLTYQWSEQLSGTSRLEFFDDIDGNRTGFEGLYTAMTLGLSYQPRPSLILRPEVRYDNNNRSRPFDDESNLFTAALDVIFRW